MPSAPWPEAPSWFMVALMRKLLLLAATICLALIVYATLTKIAGKPTLMSHRAYWVVAIERFGAYGLLGCLLSFLLSGRFAVSIVLVVGVAIVLEAAQALIPSRDPSMVDVIQKSAGGITGVLLAQIVLMFLPRRPS